MTQRMFFTILFLLIGCSTLVFADSPIVNSVKQEMDQGSSAIQYKSISGQEIHGGIDKEYYKNGQLKYILLLNDDRDKKLGGVAKGYSENGQLEYEITMNKGLKDGVYKAYYQNGRINCDKPFKDGKADGIFKYYDESGHLSGETIYKDGKEISYKEFENKTSKNSKQEVDWNKIEAQLYAKYRATNKDTEAMVEMFVGGDLLETYNQSERAVVHLKKAVKLDKKIYDAWYDLGLIYISSKEGNEYFRQAIKANPDFAAPYYWLAYNYCRARKDKEAISYFEKYLHVASEEGSFDTPSRVETAQEVLKEFRSGKEGKELKMIRLD